MSLDDLYFEYIKAIKGDVQGAARYTSESFVKALDLGFNYGLGSPEEKQSILEQWQHKMKTALDSGNEKARKWVYTGEE